MSARVASHAGSWYSDQRLTLSMQLDSFLAAAEVTPVSVKALIAPHAGYSFSGATAAFAYKAVDVKHIRRVFLLGPSHHWHTKRCALSLATHYCSPLGDVPVDAALNAELQATRQFDTMTADVDAAEHSLELHVPFLVKLFTGRPFTLVPILVGALSAESEAQYGRLLSGYLDEPDVLMVVSSDFCHWGRRFGYTPHDKAVGLVHKYVEAMDREGMRIIESGDSAAFTSYLADTRNTICGRHPIGVLLHALRSCRTPALRARFTAYAQSSRALKAGDSSVSYATAVVES